jgi:hypothetical protein
MYDLYNEKCLNDGLIPVKETFYRKIFNENFNLDFLKPKND